MISDDIRKLFVSSSMNSNQEILKTIEAIQSLNVGMDDLIFNQPDTYDLGYLTTYDIEEISTFSNGLPREFINFNLFENLYFLSFTQIKQLIMLFLDVKMSISVTFWGNSIRMSMRYRLKTKMKL